MYRLDREDFLSYRLMGLWSLMAFQAGFINSFGFLSCGRYVSHVTGFGTQIGLAMASSQFSLAVEFFGLPLFFILGSLMSGTMTISRLERGLRPRYDYVTMLLNVALVLICIGGAHGLWGPFEQTPAHLGSIALLFGLSFICGMQNGCFATLTRGLIRTTHLTGLSTDLGTDLARMWTGNLSKEEYRLARRANITRFSTIIAFSLGAIISVPTTEFLDYVALVVPVATSLIAYLVVLEVSRKMDQLHNTVEEPVIKSLRDLWNQNPSEATTREISLDAEPETEPKIKD